MDGDHVEDVYWMGGVGVYWMDGGRRVTGCMRCSRWKSMKPRVHRILHDVYVGMIFFVFSVEMWFYVGISIIVIHRPQQY